LDMIPSLSRQIREEPKPWIEAAELLISHASHSRLLGAPGFQDTAFQAFQAISTEKETQRHEQMVREHALRQHHSEELKPSMAARQPPTGPQQHIALQTHAALPHGAEEQLTARDATTGMERKKDGKKLHMLRTFKRFLS
jgi:hypothetical protein